MTGFWHPASLACASRIKMLEKIGKFALTSVFGLWLHCGTAGLLGTGERRIWESLWVFTAFSHFISQEKVTPVYSAQAVLLLCSLWSVKSLSIPYTAVCSFPSSHSKYWCHCWAPLQKDWGTLMCSPEYPCRKQTSVCYERTIFVQQLGLF